MQILREKMNKTSSKNNTNTNSSKNSRSNRSEYLNNHDNKLHCYD